MEIRLQECVLHVPESALNVMDQLRMNAVNVLQVYS